MVRKSTPTPTPTPTPYFSVNVSEAGPGNGIAVIRPDWESYPAGSQVTVEILFPTPSPPCFLRGSETDIQPEHLRAEYNWFPLAVFTYWSGDVPDDMKYRNPLTDVPPRIRCGSLT